MNFFKKKFLNLKEIKLGKIIFFILSLMFKILYCSFLAIIIPFIIFLFFIYVEPRDIYAINNYIYNKLKLVSNNNIENIKTSKISLDKKLNIIYIVENINIVNDNFVIESPKIILKINLFKFLINKKNINQINFNNSKIKIYVGDKIQNDPKNNQANNSQDFLDNFFEIVENKGFIIINNFSIKNSELIVENKSSNLIDKIYIKDSFFKFSKNNKKIVLNFDLISSVLNNKTFVGSKNNCVIYRKTLNTNCNFTLNNVSFNNIINLTKNNINYVSDYINNINGKFDIKIFVNFTREEGIKNFDFDVKSSQGEIKIYKLFADKVKYKNFTINGNIKDNWNTININTISAYISTKKSERYNLLSGNFNFLKGKNINTVIKLDNEVVNNLNILWPVFLNQNDIRKWVIKNVNSGKINNLYAFLNFDFHNNEYELNKVDANLNLNGVTLNYDESFPAIKNINGTAYFNFNDMKIDIESAESEGTKFTNSNIYINYGINGITYIDINANSYGNSYYLGYYIDYENKNNIKNIFNNYFNGFATSKIKVKVPIIDGDWQKILNKTFIEVKSELTKNNNFIFKNDSSSKLYIKKELNSLNFNVNLDLKDSKIDINYINLYKDFNKKSKINLNVKILDKKILLENIKIYDGNIIGDGKGIIENGILKNLEMFNIKYNNSDYNIKLFNDENSKISINLYGDTFKINIPNYENNINKNYNNIFKQITDEDIKAYGKINNLYFNDKYIINNVDYSLHYYNNDINYIKINSTNYDNSELLLSNINNKIKIDLDIKNFGKFLQENNLNNDISNGNLYGFIDLTEDKIKIRTKIVDNFEYKINNIDNNKTNGIKSLLNIEDISKNFKNEVKKTNIIKFSKMEAEAYIDYNEINNIKIERFMLNSVENYGNLTFSGLGTFNIKDGYTKIDGLIVPFNKLNTLLGMNKIPLINKLLFKNEDSGLITINYKIRKKNYSDNIKFEISPLSVVNPNSIKNIFLMFSIFII